MKKLFIQNCLFNRYLIVICLAVIAALFSLSIYAKNSLNKYYVTINNKNISLDIADTPASRQKGLMFVESMPENSGMLFVLEKPEFANFWMKNMKIPLDMLFISGEKIVTIYNKVPVCKIAPCQIYPSNQKVDFVLEVNSGYCEKHRINIGQTVKFSPELAKRIIITGQN